MINENDEFHVACKNSKMAFQIIPVLCDESNYNPEMEEKIWSTG